MQLFPPPVEALISQLGKLPGVGRKSAARLAFHLLSLPEEETKQFAQSILTARAGVRFCPVCQNLTDSDTCALCQNPARDTATLCVVSEARDVASIERTREFTGLYHVLHGVLSPMSHIGPDDLRIRELLARVEAGGVREVIMATNPDTEGEATALYLAKLLRPFGVLVTRLAYGIPMGGHLEFADEITLTRALDGRREI